MNDGRPIPERLQALTKAQTSLQKLMDHPRDWGNECETVFSELRRPVVHLRRDMEALDAADNKDLVWRFLCKFSKDRPPFHARCEEVLKILMLSDAWMQKLLEIPAAEHDLLPPGVLNEVKKRLKDVDGGKEGKGPDRDDWKSPGEMSMVIVVQRCSKAKVLVDAEGDRWDEIGRGLVLTVSFSANASEERVALAARSILLAPLSCTGPGAKPESVLALCKRGEEQGIAVLPQASLISQLGEGDGSVTYQNLCEEGPWGTLYKAFLDTLSGAVLTMASDAKAMPKIVSSRFGDSQSWEVSSDGFMHSFIF